MEPRQSNDPPVIEIHVTGGGKEARMLVIQTRS